MASKNLAHHSSLIPTEFWKALSFDWLVISVCIAGFAWAENLTLGFLLSLVVAGRQHALFVLTHEGAHFRNHKLKAVNDWASNLLAAIPILMTVEAYRDNHLQHHQFTNSEKDPDWNRKVGKSDWTFPKTRKELGLSLGKYFLGFGILEMIFAFPILSGARPLNWKKRAHRASVIALVLFHALLLFLSWKFTFVALTLFWYFSYFYWLPLLNRIRSIAEHFALDFSDEYHHSRNVVEPTWIERLLVSPHHVNFHLTHHLYPSIPFYKLPAAHLEFLQENMNYRDGAHTQTYFGAKNSLYMETTFKGEKLC